MNKNYKTLLLCTVGAFLLAACGPKKEEKAPLPSEQADQMTKPQAPAVTPAPAASEAPATKTLTPEEKDKLKIEEENVFDENVPG